MLHTHPPDRGILLNLKSATDALSVTYRNFSAQKFLRTVTDTFDSCFNGQLMT